MASFTDTSGRHELWLPSLVAVVGMSYGFTGGSGRQEIWQILLIPVVDKGCGFLHWLQ